MAHVMYPQLLLANMGIPPFAGMNQNAPQSMYWFGDQAANNNFSAANAAHEVAAMLEQQQQQQHFQKQQFHPASQQQFGGNGNNNNNNNGYGQRRQHNPYAAAITPAAAAADGESSRQLPFQANASVPAPFLPWVQQMQAMQQQQQQLQLQLQAQEQHQHQHRGHNGMGHRGHNSNHSNHNNDSHPHQGGSPGLMGSSAPSFERIAGNSFANNSQSALYPHQMSNHNHNHGNHSGHNNYNSGNNHASQHGHHGHQQQHHQHHGNNNNSNGNNGNGGQQHQVVSLDEVLSHQGRLAEMARTANGSSFIQSALRSGNDDANLRVIWCDLEPCFADLLLDAHGCYVIKSILERLPQEEIRRVVNIISKDSQLVFSMCTHSLHTRRVVQYLLDTVDCSFILSLLTTQCAAIATTQQGCIIMQRAMDVAAEPHRSALFGAIYHNLYAFAKDPFGNYVVQHMLEIGDRSANSHAFVAAFTGHVVELSCNKFSSNVVEKALFHVLPEAQHTLLLEMYSGGDEVLYQMLQDSFGNYIIQSSIALAAFRDVFYMAEQLRQVLQRTPYGHKIEARLERRLKGKPVGTRSPMTAGAAPGTASGNGPQQQQTRGPNQGSSSHQQRGMRAFRGEASPSASAPTPSLTPPHQFAPMALSLSQQQQQQQQVQAPAQAQLQQQPASAAAAGSSKISSAGASEADAAADETVQEPW